MGIRRGMVRLPNLINGSTTTRRPVLVFIVATLTQQQVGVAIEPWHFSYAPLRRKRTQNKFNLKNLRSDLPRRNYQA